MEFFSKLYYVIFFLLVKYLKYSLGAKSILNSTLSSIIYSYEPYQGNCSANNLLVTEDKGYLAAGEISFLLGEQQKYFIIIKFDYYNNIQFKVKILENYDNFETHRLQETAKFYYLIVKAKNNSDSEYTFIVYRMSKTGKILINLKIDNECVYNQDLYKKMLFIVYNDGVMISACNLKINHHDVRFHATLIDNQQNEILYYRLQGDVQKSRPCYIYTLINVVHNFKTGTIFFAGKVLCDLSILECLLFIYPVWSNFVFSVKFLSPQISYWRETTPLSFCKCSKDRNDAYDYFSNYEDGKDNYIGINIESDFTIIYSIVGEDSQWRDKKAFSRPSNINPSFYPNFESSQVSFDKPYFSITGKFKDPQTNIELLLAGYYLNDTTVSGIIVQFPINIPSSCTVSNCFFLGQDIIRLSNGNFVVVGISHFANSVSTEWLRIVYNKLFQMILCERKPSNNKFIPIASSSLSDGSIIIAGQDMNALALMQISNTYEKMDEDRFITGENLFITSITSTTVLTFFVAGYTKNFDDPLNYGIILEIGEMLGISRSYQFSFDSRILSIIYFQKTIYGIINDYLSQASSLIFHISSSLTEETLIYKALSNIKLNNMAIIQDNRIALIGNKYSGQIFFAIYNLDLDVLINSPDFSKSKIPAFQLSINLYSVASTYSGNIVAVGSITNASQDCFAILVNPSLGILNYDTFGSKEKDTLNQVISLQDKNVLMTGYQSNTGFIRLYSPKLSLILEKLFSEQIVILNTLVENLFEQGIASGYQLSNLNTNLVYYTFEISLECDSGFYFDPDSKMCIEICGDSNDLGNYECDNKELVCCMANCTLSPGYSILTDPVNKIQYCNTSYNITATSSLLISQTVKSTQNGDNKIVLKFSKNITLCDALSSGKLTLNDIKSQVSLFLKNNTGSKIGLTITNLKYDYCDSIELSFLDKAGALNYSSQIQIDLSGLNLEDSNKVTISQSIFNYNLKMIRGKLFSNDVSSSITINPTQRLLVFLGSFSAIMLSFLGQGVDSIFAYMGPLQIMCLFTLINIKPFPDQFNQVINANSIISLNIDILQPSHWLLSQNVVNVISSNDDISDNSFNHPSLIYVNFFLNLQMKILILVAYPSFFVIIYILSKFWKYFEDYLDEMIWNRFIKLFNGLYFEFLICSWMQLYHNNSQFFWITNLSNCFSIIFIIGFCLYIVKIFSILCSQSLTNLLKPNMKKRIGSLYSKIREKEIAKFNLLFSYLRRFFSIFFLFALMNYPVVQSIFFSLISIFYIFWLVIGKAVKDRIDEASNLLIEITILVCHISFFCLTIVPHSSEMFLSLVILVMFCVQFATFLKSGFSYLNVGYLIIMKLKRRHIPKINENTKTMNKINRKSNLPSSTKTSTLKKIGNQNKCKEASNPPNEIAKSSFCDFSNTQQKTGTTRKIKLPYRPSFNHNNSTENANFEGKL